MSSRHEAARAFYAIESVILYWLRRVSALGCHVLLLSANVSNRFREEQAHLCYAIARQGRKHPDPEPEDRNYSGRRQREAPEINTRKLWSVECCSIAAEDYGLVKNRMNGKPGGKVQHMVWR